MNLVDANLLLYAYDTSAVRLVVCDGSRIRSNFNDAAHLRRAVFDRGSLRHRERLVAPAVGGAAGADAPALATI